MMNKVAVIGGGPAGMIAAGYSAKKGNEVTLFEKNKFLGKKLLITGKGRCNVTNDCDIESLIENVCTNNSFLYSSFYSFTNEDVKKFFYDFGVKLKTERGNRVFPLSDKSSDIRDALKSFIIDNNVNIIYESVLSINKEDNGFMIECIREKFSFDKVIIATGGLSYPETGSTGDGYIFAKKLGHTLINTQGALVPIETIETFPSEMMGLSLKNVSLTLYENNKKRFSDIGEMLFTHFGISGPLVLSASSHINKNSENTYSFILDFKPGLDEKKLDERILRDFSKYSNKDFVNSLGGLLPKKAIPVIVKLTGIDERKKVNLITKEERRKLLESIKLMKMTFKKFRPIEEAIITSGGINVNEIDPSTMESRLVKGLYFAGEVIDVDAYTGGFNLQIAFSTGYLAGNNT